MIDDDGEVSEFSREVALASLVVRLHVGGDAKESMLDRAVREEEMLEDIEDEEDPTDEDPDEYAAYCRGVNDFDDLGELLAIISTEFQFDAENTVQVHLSQRLLAPDGEIIWQPRTVVDRENPEAHTPIHMPRTFNEADMDLLESGLGVFRAPKAILHALEEIRQHPMVS